MASSFAAGMRAWLEVMPTRPLEYEVLDLDPWLPTLEDAVVNAAAGTTFMAWILSTNWDVELLRVEVAERLGWEGMLELFPELPTEAPSGIPGTAASGRRRALDLLRAAPPLPNGQGSNNWVVSGVRTATGKPLLANDPHLLVQVPSIWFECHLTAPGYDASGVALPFAPGYNEWGVSWATWLQGSALR